MNLPQSTVSGIRMNIPSNSRRGFYVGLTLSVILLNVVAFAPPIIDQSARTVPLPLTTVDLTHAIVSAAWLLLFLGQVALIATGRPSAHRRLGIIGVVLSVALIVTTWFMLVEGARRGFDLSGDLVPRGTSLTPSEYLAPANALLCFGILMGAAVWNRRQFAVHKRLMALAMLSTTGAPLAHLIGHWPGLRAHLWLNPVIGGFILFLPAIHDKIVDRRVHPVSLWGAIGLFVYTFLFFVGIAPTAAWQEFTAWVIR